MPLLVSGSHSCVVDAVFAVLGVNPEVISPRTSPAVHPLLVLYKLAVLLESPHLLQFLSASHLFYFSYLGFDGDPPPYNYVPEADPDNFLVSASRRQWIRELWNVFRRKVRQQRPNSTFYAGRVAAWFPAELHEVMPSLSLYCFQDPRDVWHRAKAQLEKGRTTPALDDAALGRGIALDFLQNFENYFAQRSKANVLLLRCEELAGDPSTPWRWLARTTENVTVPDHDFHSIPAIRELKFSEQQWEREPLPDPVISTFMSAISDEMAWLGYETASTTLANKRCIRFDKRELNLSTFRTRQARLEPQDDFTLVHVNGRDCQVVLPFESFPADEVRNIWVSLSTEVGEVCSIYWRSENTHFSEERVVYLRLTPNRHWTVLSFPMHTHPLWRGQIAELRLDLFNMITRGWLRRWRSPYPPHRGVGKIRWVKLVA